MTLQTSEVHNPDEVTKSYYTYLADGTKLGVKDATGQNGYEYQGSLVYALENGERRIESAAFGAGRIIASNSTAGTDYEPNYFIKDHLGSVRTVVNSQGAVQSENNYHAFGARWQDTQSQISNNRYLYNGKELQTTTNLGFLDYGARMYLPLRGVFTRIDPLADKYFPVSPFVYCLNNPIKHIDKEGKNPFVVIGGAVLTVTDIALISTGVVATGVIWQKSKDGGFIELTSGAKQFVEDAGIKWQQRKEREAKEGLDANQANVQQSIENNFGGPTPEGDQQPRNNNNKIGVAVFVIGTVARGAEEVLKWIPTDKKVEEKSDKNGAIIIQQKDEKPTKTFYEEYKEKEEKRLY